MCSTNKKGQGRRLQFATVLAQSSINSSLRSNLPNIWTTTSVDKCPSAIPSIGFQNLAETVARPNVCSLILIQSLRPYCYPHDSLGGCYCCNANADGIPRGEMSSYEDVTTSCEPHDFCLFGSKPPLHVLKRFSCSLFSFSLVSSDSFERAFKNVIHSMVGNPRECFPEESS